MAFPSKKEELYTYGDYLHWPSEERWEIIEGVPYNMSPAPSRQHQEVMLELARQISTFLLDAECKVYVAPFDVRLPESDADEDDAILTVVQPDILVVCDLEKLDDRGCCGAPDFIIEILSPGTAARDQVEKAGLYEKHGVKEYWTVHPTDHLVYVKRLQENGTYDGWTPYAPTGEMEVSTLPGLHIDLKRVFDIT